MLRSLYTAATGMEAQQLRMDLTANNLANANTSGFKKARAEFEPLMTEVLRQPQKADGPGSAEPMPLEVGLGVKTAGTVRAFSQGAMQATQSPTDLAIEGHGFFQVLTNSGEVAFTRAGNLKVDSQGRLTTPRGEPLEPPITLPGNTTSITVKPDGSVSVTQDGKAEATDVGRLDLAVFPNPAGLTAVGHLLVGNAASGDPMILKPGEDGAGTIAQGYLEGSNVQAVEEMIDMIVTQRAFEMSSKVIQTADQMLQKLTNIR